MGLLASETLHSLCSIAGPTSGPSRLWKKDALLDSPLGGWTKGGQRRCRALETKAQGLGLAVGRALCAISTKLCFKK